MPAILTSIIIGAISAALFTTVVNNAESVKDVMYSNNDLTPVNRSVLQNYTTVYTNRVTEKYIRQTVNVIYKATLHEAALRKSGYKHPFSPLLPIHVYPSSTYVPKIIAKLEKLFPDCQVEMNDNLGMYIIQWR